MIGANNAPQTGYPAAISISNPRFAAFRVIKGAPGATDIRYRPPSDAIVIGSTCASNKTSTGGKTKVTKSSRAHAPNASFRQFSTNCLQFKLIPVDSIKSKTAIAGRKFILSGSK